MKILTVLDLQLLLKRHGFDNFMLDLMKALRRDFGRWDSFTQMPRPAMYVPGGVLELMPVCDNTKYYSYKYVNCHPKNTAIGLQTVIATGQLSRIDTGYPVMFSEMTMLTAFRTAATVAIATDLMARKNVQTVGIIGTGAQSEFQIRALQLVRDIKEVRFFDRDPKAMLKFAKNTTSKSPKLVACDSAEDVVCGVDVVTSCIASRSHEAVIKNDWIQAGMHINGVGGDSPGKTELEKSIVSRANIVVEYFDQSIIEGEIQQLGKAFTRKRIRAELHELVRGLKKGRKSEDEITLFDSVGIALEDYSVLRLTYELAETYKIGQELGMTPALKDPKNLFSVVL